jgi:4-hydroxyproline epimerase
MFRSQFDMFRSAVVNEPRGSDVMVGALLCPAVEPGCVSAVIFFNNVGYLGMCGHGTMGVAAALAHLGRIDIGGHRLETPVGVVSMELEDANTVAVNNVPSYRLAKRVKVQVPGFGTVHGDVAWGGNWFFLVEDHRQELKLKRTEVLTDLAWRIRLALQQQGIAGANGEEIDHIELFGPPRAPGADSCNFVLCPGRAYDRSPCGTGTSAKLACLAADGKLKEGQIWRQESIIGSIFEASYQHAGERILPRIAGKAYVNAQTTLILDPRDPFVMGIRP